MTVERRAIEAALTLRADPGEAAPSVAGIAARYGVDTVIGDAFVERIAAGAFADAVGRDDVIFSVNHSDIPLARTSSGTLMLTEDAVGLKMSARLDPADPDVAALVPKIARGDLGAMSFAFRVDAEHWDESGPMPVRTIERVRLVDVSIVTWPAYPETEIALRSLAAAQASKATARAPDPRALAVRGRGRIALAAFTGRGPRP